MKHWLGIFALLCLSLPAFAACPDATNNAGYINANVSGGTGSGNSWTNACSAFSGSCAISSLVRGCTYYVAKGGSVTYNGSGVITAYTAGYCAGDETCSFNTADSSTSLITIQAPTASNHGTATGYSSALLGQAVFGPILVNSDYWTFLGTNDLLTVPSNNTASYGIIFINGISGTPVDATAVIVNQGTNNTFKYLDIEGPQNTTTAGTGDVGIQTGQSGTTGPTYMGYNHMHDSSIYPCCHIFGETGDTVEYNWIENNCCVGGQAHRGGMNPAVYFAVGETNLIIRFNYFENLNGTAYIDYANSPSATATHTNHQIYGNVFWCNTGDPHYNGNACAGGDGVISFLGNTSGAPIDYNGIYVFNNVIDSLISANGDCGINLAGGHQANFTNFYIQNNIFSNCAANPPVCGANSATCTGTVTFDSNTFYNIGGGNTPWTTNSTPTSTNTQTLGSSLYVNGGTNTAGDNNYQLTADTSAWANVNSLVSGNSVDLLGNTRTSSRGAFQFNGSGPTVTPAPALGMFAWDWDPLEGIAP